MKAPTWTPEMDEAYAELQRANHAARGALRRRSLEQIQRDDEAIARLNRAREAFAAAWDAANKTEKST